MYVYPLIEYDRKWYFHNPAKYWYTYKSWVLALKTQILNLFNYPLRRPRGWTMNRGWRWKITRPGQNSKISFSLALTEMKCEKKLIVDMSAKAFIIAPPPRPPSHHPGLKGHISKKVFFLHIQYMLRKPLQKCLKFLWIFLHFRALQALLFVFPQKLTFIYFRMDKAISSRWEIYLYYLMFSDLYISIE